MRKCKLQLMIVSACFCLMALFSAKSTWAEVIQLKSGHNIKGPIITRADDYVKVDMGIGITVTYYLDEINKITADSKNSAEFEEYQIFLNQQLEHIKRIQNMYQKNAPAIAPTSAPVNLYTQKVDQQIKDIESTVNNLDKDFPNELQKLTSGLLAFFAQQGQHMNRFFQVIVKLLSLKFIVENVLPSKITLMIVVSWIVACYPMMLLAKKRQEDSYWMAWFPILHIYLLTKLTQRSSWWVVYLLIPMLIIVVPFMVPVEFYKWWFFGGLLIGTINFFIVPALLWSKLAEEMNQPAWWGVLTIIPIVNIIMVHKFNQTFVSPASKREQYLNRIAPHLGSKN